jgi:hypothetical protein
MIETCFDVQLLDGVGLGAGFPAYLLPALRSERFCLRLMSERSVFSMKNHLHSCDKVCQVSINYTIDERCSREYFSVLTFHGRNGATRLNQGRYGAALAKSAWYWLKQSPASGSVISKATSIGVTTNRVYQLKTHARPAACDIIRFRLHAAPPRVW